VVVTGATGFLGSHLVKLLLELGADVAVLIRDEVPPTPISSSWLTRVSQVRGAVEDQATIERLLGEYGARSVFHLAAQTQVEVANNNPPSTFEANVAGTWCLLEACRRSPDVEQIVLASSDKAYGAQPILPYTEEMPLLATNPYDVSKACADLIAQSYARTYGLPVAITRCGNFFGPGDTNWRRLVPGAIRDVVEGRRPLIRSDGTPTRDYLYIVDGALAYVCLAEALVKDSSAAGETFNFSTETPLSVLALVELIQSAAGTNLEPEIRGTATNEIAHQYLSAAKARERLGWCPAYSIQEAMTETMAWYRELLTADS
jgi:CDP-glucose 4,6-dehydratase